jgi:DNA-binding NtrC family response regulator
MKPKILLVDDDINLTSEIQLFLENQNFNVDTAHTIKSALELIKSVAADVYLLDLKLPDGTGLEILDQIKTKYPERPVLMLSGFGTVPDAVEAVKKGAENFLNKPVDPDHLLLILKRLVEKRRSDDRLIIQDLELSDQRKMVLGNSRKMRKLIETCNAAAKARTTILIHGETGTGKHLLAHYIHQQSPRKKFPFVYVNCAALSETLLESDLFGHEKGSFTGAVKQKRGRIELAHHGTLFFDEIAEIPPNIQAKILHFIEYGEFQRLGSTEQFKSDTRIICATNRDLFEEVKAGNFREDLFYRINVIRLHIPPLRERGEDIGNLLEFFLEKFSSELGKPLCSIKEDTRIKLEMYAWPGNIRELQNAVERATVLCTSRILNDNDFPFLDRPPASETDNLLRARPLNEAMENFKKEYLTNLLKQTGGNQTQAAKILKIQRTYLSRLIKELELKD